MDARVFRELQAQDWAALFKSVLYHAECRASRYYWRVGQSLDLAKGWTPEDVAQHVIMKTISGERRWDPEKGPLLPWLKRQVDSGMDALARSRENRYEAAFPETTEDTWEWLPAAGGRAGDPRNPRIEEEALSASERMSELWEAIDDEELAEVVRALADGCEPEPRYLAEWLGVPREEIYNRKRRLKRLWLREVGHVRRT